MLHLEGQRVNLGAGRLGLRTLRLLSFLNEPLPLQYEDPDPRLAMTEEEWQRLHEPAVFSAQAEPFARSSLRGYKHPVVLRMEAIDEQISARRDALLKAPKQRWRLVDSHIAQELFSSQWAANKY